MKKTLVTMLMVICLAALCCGYAAAADVPLELETTVSGGMLTVSVKSGSAFSYANMTVTLGGIPSDAECKEFTTGSDFSDYGASGILNAQNLMAALLTTDNKKNTRVAAGKEMLLAKFDVSKVTPGDYTINLHVNTVADINGTALSWEGSTISEECNVFFEFSDVTKAEDPVPYYYTPVYWAVENGIAKGYSDNTFGPKLNCTREDMVVFLWRLFGKPDPENKKSPFSDVKSGAYYYKAVLWAAENGITKGYDTGNFGVGDSVTREDMVTFLYRAAGRPEISKTSSGFSDVAVGKYYNRAIIWAAENSITKGYSDGTFGVGENCLREHIVTFMYRYAKYIGKR